jgi:hypothetical protein
MSRMQKQVIEPQTYSMAPLFINCIREVANRRRRKDRRRHVGCWPDSEVAEPLSGRCDVYATAIRPRSIGGRNIRWSNSSARRIAAYLNSSASFLVMEGRVRGLGPHNLVAEAIRREQRAASPAITRSQSADTPAIPKINADKTIVAGRTRFARSCVPASFSFR